MVHCICEVFADYDVIFAGEVYGKFPVWLNGFDNLHYIDVPYDELPKVIQTFDVTILPFFGRHSDTVPKEFYQFLACGKQVIASCMPNLPDSVAVYKSESVEEAVNNIKKALCYCNDEYIIKSA